MPSQETQDPVISRPGLSLTVAIMPAAAVVLTVATAFLEAADKIQAFMLAASACIMLVLLIHLYIVIKGSAQRQVVAPARLHLLLHLVPLIFFLLYRSGANSSWIPPGLVLLFVLFFASGRKTWAALAKVFPSTLLYRIFYRGNTAFLTSFPLLYLASLVAPDFFTFSTIKGVALFYFSIHFMILGLASVKIQSDLRSLE